MGSTTKIKFNTFSPILNSLLVWDEFPAFWTCLIQGSMNHRQPLINRNEDKSFRPWTPGLVRLFLTNCSFQFFASCGFPCWTVRSCSLKIHDVSTGLSWIVQLSKFSRSRFFQYKNLDLPYKMESNK